MENTEYDLLDLAALRQWRGGCDNTERLTRLRRNLPLAIAQELTPRQRQMVELHYFQGKSVTAIALELGINKSTVSRNIQRANQKLQNSLRYSL